MSLLRRIPALALLLALPFVLTACGFNVQTDQVYQPGDGVVDRSGNVDILNAVIVSEEDGRGAFVATLVNNDLYNPSTLLSVTNLDSSEETTVEASTEIEADGLVNLAEEYSPPYFIESSAVKAGYFVKLRLNFEDGQQNTIRVQVMEKTKYYEDVSTIPGLGLDEETGEPIHGKQQLEAIAEREAQAEREAEAEANN